MENKYTNPIIEVKNLKKYFPITSGFFKKTVGYVKAVDNIDMYINEGETLALVGESGCGKTTLGRCILQAIKPTSGSVLFNNKENKQVELTTMPYSQLRDTRRDMQMIFQDPYASLDSRYTVSQIIEEPLILCRKDMSRADRAKRVKELMDIVGLAQRFVNTYPHELDGGRRQRIGVARALALDPKFIVCDEPVSALDVSIQAQILNLIMDLQDDMGLSYMFITHDLSVVKHISNNIAVMYLGQCIEHAPTEELFANPMHPYTKALLAAIPLPDPARRNQEREIIRGEVTSPIDPPPGCRFAARCPFATEECRHKPVELKEVSSGHFLACARFGG